MESRGGSAPVSEPEHPLPCVPKLLHLANGGTNPCGFRGRSGHGSNYQRAELRWKPRDGGLLFAEGVFARRRHGRIKDGLDVTLPGQGSTQRLRERSRARNLISQSCYPPRFTFDLPIWGFGKQMLPVNLATWHRDLSKFPPKLITMGAEVGVSSLCGITCEPLFSTDSDYYYSVAPGCRGCSETRIGVLGCLISCGKCNEPHA